MRGWTYVASIAVHALAVGIVAVAPHETSGRSASDGVQAIEIVMIETVPAETRVEPPAPPPEPPSPEAPAVTDVTPRAPEASRPEPRVASINPLVDPSAVPPTDPATSGDPAATASTPPAPTAPVRDPHGRPIPSLGLPSLRDTARSFAPPADASPLGGNPPPTIGWPERRGPYLGEPAGGGKHVYRRAAFTGAVAEDGAVQFADNPDWQGGFFADPKEGVGYKAKFDATDWVMRTFMGEDPYRYEKAKFLDETREERNAMALTARRERLRDAIVHLPRWLERVWSDEARTVSERRILLFMLWDECAEAGPEEVVRAATEARAIIVGFVRRRLPAGSAEAFGPAELEMLNKRRQSSQVFAPYADAE